MSDTPVDMAKVTQMLDSGWHVCLFKNELGSYSANALRNIVDRETGWRVGRQCETDDFTPEQALTRLAYMVHGEIL